MWLPLLLFFVPPRAFSAKPTCNLQRPITPYFLSFNLNNILVWDAPEENEFRYTVQYRKYGTQSWQKKKECTNITVTKCDLTNETHATEEAYFGKVVIKNKNCSQSFQTEKFNFKTDSIAQIGPPTINLIPGDTSIKINLTHPLKYNDDIYKSLRYYIYLNDKEIKDTKEPYYEITNLDPGTTYCITSKVHWFYKESNLSDKTCIATNADHTSQKTIERMMYAFFGALIFCMVTLMGCAIHKYIHASNLKQPKILNISTINNKNAISVDAHRVTINLVTIESGKAYQQDPIVATKEEDKDFQNENNLNITDDKDYITYDSGVTDEVSETSHGDYGYVSLLEQKPKPTAKPTISPYDMPHHLPETIALVSTSTDTVCEERNLYGYCKSNESVSPLQENDELNSIPNESEKKNTTNYFYVPQGVFDSTNKARLKEDLSEPVESYTEQELYSTANIIADTGSNESAMLFVDWSPDDTPLYISNLSKKQELENCIKQCQDEKEGLLSQLYLPPQVSNDDQLGELEVRWGLFIQDAEK